MDSSKVQIVLILQGQAILIDSHLAAAVVMILNCVCGVCTSSTALNEIQQVLVWFRKLIHVLYADSNGYITQSGLCECLTLLQITSSPLGRMECQTQLILLLQMMTAGGV